MRKVLSFVLVLALVLGSFSMAFAAPFSDMASEKSSEAVSVLKDLGVVAGYPDGTFRPDQIVTRAEMARFIIASLGLEQFATGTTSKYPDMVQAPWAQGYVAYATSIGFISGYPDGTFKPNQQVSYQEAASMLVRALGYTEAFLPGGWPAEWMIKANSLGIFDGVSMTSGAAGANRGDIAQMLYNSLELLIGQVNNDNVWEAFKPDDTMLIRLGAKLIAADDAEALDKAGFADDGIIYGNEDTLVNLRAYVGAYADRYVNKNDEIIKVLPVSVFLTGEYDGDGVFEADNGTDYNIASTLADNEIPGFWNGVNTDTWALDETSGYFEEDEWDTVTIAVKVSGKTIKEIYTTAYWDANEFDLYSDSYKDEIADDQALMGVDFALDDDDEIDFKSFELLGVDSLDDIDEDNVVYVYASFKANGIDYDHITKIAVGTKTVTGKVTIMNNAETTFTIAGKSYDISYYNDSKPDLGDTGTAYLDYFGEIYAWDPEDSSVGNYALVLAASDAENTVLDKDRVKLLLADGTSKVFNAKESAYGTVSAITTGALITYSVDKDGVLTKINVQSVLTTTTAAVTGKLNAAGTIFDGKAVSSKVVVFTFDGTDYDVAKLSDVTRDDSLKAESNYVGTFTPADGSRIEVMIIDADSVGGRSSVYAVLNSLKAAWNDDDVKVQYVSGFADGKAFTAWTEADGEFTTLGFADATIYKLKVDSDGVVTDSEKVTTTKGSLEAYWDGNLDAKDGTYLIQVDGVWTTIDSNAVVYQLDTVNKKYILRSASSLRVDDMVYLWQADKDSEVYDIVIYIRGAM
jgi:hypothetical protein